MNRYKASKQADVLMLFYLFSAEELRELLEPPGYELPADAIPRAVDYYLARTSQGSTLSAVVHVGVGVGARPSGGSTRVLRAGAAQRHRGRPGWHDTEGHPPGGMVSSVDLLQRCFAGLETRGNVLWINPYWPAELGTLEFDVLYREHLVTLRITEDQAEVLTGPGAHPPIQIGFRGDVVEVGPGETISFAV